MYLGGRKIKVRFVQRVVSAPCLPETHESASSAWTPQARARQASSSLLLSIKVLEFPCASSRVIQRCKVPSSSSFYAGGLNVKSTDRNTYLAVGWQIKVNYLWPGNFCGFQREITE